MTNEVRALFFPLLLSAAVSSEVCRTTFVIQANAAIDGTLLSSQPVESLAHCSRICTSEPKCEAFKIILAKDSRFLCTLLSNMQDTHLSKKSTATGRKVCLPDECGSRSFAFEIFPNLALKNSSFVISAFPIDGDGCLAKCQTEGNCRAAIFNRETSMCQLSRIALNSVFNPRAFFEYRSKVDVFENNCIRHTMSPSACTFMRVKGGGIKKLADQIAVGVGSVQACEQMCIARTNLADPCRSYTFDSANSECRLDRASSRLAGVSPLQNLEPNLQHGDLDFCIDFLLKCREDSFELQTTSMHLFNGIMSTKKSRDVICEQRFKGEFEFSGRFNFSGCGFREVRSPQSTFTGVVHLKEGSTGLVTLRDKTLQVTCRVHSVVDEQLVAANFGVRRRNTSSRPIPNNALHDVSARKQTFTIKLLSDNNSEVDVVNIGGHGWISISVLPESYQDFTVSNLIARDTNTGAFLQLIDKNGCVIRRDVVTYIKKPSRNELLFRVNFYGFEKRTEVAYDAVVETCLLDCLPKCNFDLLEPAIHSIGLRIDSFRQRRHIAVNNRVELTTDVYKLRGPRVLFVPKEINEFTSSPARSGEQSEQAEYLQIDEKVVGLTSLEYCFITDITCAVAFVLALIQMCLFCFCIVVFYCFAQRWLATSTEETVTETDIHNINFESHELPKMSNVR